MNEIQEIIEHLERIALLDSKRDAFSRMSKVSKLTKEIWNSHYEELLIELSKSENKLIRDIDYQAYWYECLGFKTACGPLFRDFSGNTMGCYGGLPSDFNKVSGYHDSNLNYASFENDRLSLYIDLFGEWGAITPEKYDCLLRFDGVFRIYCSKESGKFEITESSTAAEIIRGTPIVSASESPSIDYLLNSYGIKKDLDLIKYRLFNINFFGSDKYAVHDIVVFARKWDKKFLKKV